MAVLTADQIAQRWAQGMGSQVTRQRYIDGVTAVTENPMAAAARQENFYLERVTAAVQSGYYRNKLNSIPIGRWKDGCTIKGAPRLGPGAQASLGKMREFAQRFMPVWAQIRAEVRAMPKGGIDEAVAKVRRTIELLKAASPRAAAVGQMMPFAQ